MAEAAFNHALAGRKFARSGVGMEPISGSESVSLRARSQAVAALGRSIGLELPIRPKTSAEAAGVNVFWLGPDEWLLLAAEGAGVHKRLSSSQAGLFSAVDISHRNVGIAIWGEIAATTLASGCPQDLSLASFPVGACSRTVLGKAEIVLIRFGPEAFRVECWRSFADYVWNYLVDAAKSA